MIKSLIVKLRQFSDLKLKKDEHYQDYLKVLELFYHSKFKSSLNHLGKLLVNDPEHPYRFELYRAWIEILSHQGDKLGLKELAEHLLFRGLEDSKFRSHWVAQRGLSLLNLDEIEAFRLMSVDQLAHSKNPYGLELAQLLDGRKQVLKKNYLQSSRVVITDYFHWKSLLATLATRKRHPDWNSFVRKLKSQFPGLPLTNEFSFCVALMEKNKTTAKRHILNLVERFPKFEAYRLYASLILYEQQKYDQVLNLTKKPVRNQYKEEFEAIKALSQYRLLQGEIENQAQLSKSLSKAMTKTALANLPNQHLLLENPQLLPSAELNFDVSNLFTTKPGSVWAVKLNLKQQYTLKDQRAGDIQYLTRPLGKEAGIGDLVFIFYDDPFSSHRWRLLAIYTVQSDACFDPIAGQVYILRLIARLQRPVPIDIASDQDEKQEVSKSVYFELDSTGLKVITEAIKGCQQEDWEYINSERLGAG